MNGTCPPLPGGTPAFDRHRLALLAATYLIARSGLREIGPSPLPDDDPEAAEIRREANADLRAASRRLAAALDACTVYLAAEPFTGTPVALRRLSRRRVAACPAVVLPPIDLGTGLDASTPDD